MSLDRCLDLIAERFDRNRDLEGLVEELAELESESLEAEGPKKYHETLSGFLLRADELLSEDELDEDMLLAAIANFRADLEKIKSNQVPDDPLEHLFYDMTRFEAGTIPAATALTTLGKYEALLLALRRQFEQSTDPNDLSEIANMMRKGLEVLETAAKRLRTDLGNGLDFSFDEIRNEFNEGTQILVEFRSKAVFVNKDGDRV